MGSTDDWSDDDVGELVAMAARLQARPLDLARCWMSESGLRTTAHNPNGDAAGLFQAMPATLKGLGFPGDHSAFRALSVRQQLHCAEKYYAPHRGLLVSPGAVYLSTFLPALMSHAGEGAFVLCGRFGPHQVWYQANSGLDANKDGWITVNDLTARIALVTTGARWTEFARRVVGAIQDADTIPEGIREDNRDQVLGDGDGTTSETFPGPGDEPPPEAA
jgi:hypothetical protein